MTNSSAKKDMPAANGDPSFFDKQQGAFYRKIDWAAFWTCFLITLAAYFITLAPTVTLEDSGELAVASDYLGVPHPPGYPIWTLLTWFFQWIFHWVQFNGHPNPAWGVGFCSAFFGALACGLLSLVVSRSGADILRTMKRTTDILGQSTESLICWITGVTGGLLFAFSPVLWSQSTIVEVYSMNAFFLMIVLVLVYMWMCRPHDDRLMYGIAFLFGLGLTNHQSLLFLGLALFTAYLSITIEELKAVAKKGDVLFRQRLGKEAVRLLISVALVFLGISFYAYMPFSSEQNPPMNWGYPRTTEGFKHAISRGQYEKISPAVNFQKIVKDPSVFIKQIHAIVTDPARKTISVVAQFTVWLSLFTIVPLFFLGKISRRSRYWLITTLVAFLSMTVIFIIFQFPKLDIQTLFIGRVQYIQAHAIFAMWISYGLIFSLTMMETVLKKNKPVLYASLLVILLLPLIPILRNAYEKEYIRLGGACEQNGHDFGWQFGYYQLKGANGIILDYLYHQKDPDFLIDDDALLYMKTRGVPEDAVSRTASYIDAGAMKENQYADTVLKELKGKPRQWVREAGLLSAYKAEKRFILNGQTLAALKKDGMPDERIDKVKELVSDTPRAYRELKDQIKGLNLDERTRVMEAAGITFYGLNGPLYMDQAASTILKQQGWTDEELRKLKSYLSDDPYASEEALTKDLKRLIKDLPAEKQQMLINAAATSAHRKHIPNPYYPMEMGPNAVFYGGTDPGRFVPTYMIYSAHVREDVYLITQNALADNTYMNVMRDLYGDSIWIASQQDSNYAFQKYVDDVKSGRIQAGADVQIVNGRVSVQGVQGVMQINGILAELIFEANKYDQEPNIMEAMKEGQKLEELGVRTWQVDGQTFPVREFYVEESYVIPWMYPYLEPHGLIMRINPEQIQLTNEMIHDDTVFWDWYGERLINRREFQRDVVAQKTFSKLRSAIAGLYAARGRMSEAETAFEQAIDLYPLSPEANFRLADVLMRQRKFDKAQEVMEHFLREDPGNDRVQQFITQIENTILLEERKRQLETKFQQGQAGNINEALELAEVYRRLQQWPSFENLTKRIIRDDRVPDPILLQVAKMYADSNRYNLLEEALQLYLNRQPNDPRKWLDLAAAQAAQRKLQPTLESLKQAIRKGGEPVRSMIRQDPRFNEMKNHPEFQKIVPPMQFNSGPLRLPGNMQNFIQ